MADESVLVVDDSPTILKVVQLVLTKAGYRTFTASGGEAGLFAAKEEPPSLILLDHRLPDLNGDDVCRAMSGDTVLSRIPVVMMTGDTGSASFEELPNVVDHLTKPFSPDALLAVVQQALRRGPAPPAPADETTERDALSGDLGLVSIADVLTWLQDQAQTGTLTLEGDTARLEVFVRGGRVDLAVARGVPEEFLLGRFLVRCGALDGGALAAVVADRARRGSRGPLGADLVQRQLCTADDLNRGLTLQTTALLYEGMSWGRGRFRFRAQAELPELARDAGLALPIDGLVMEGLRRVDEWRLIEREVGGLDTVFVRDDDRIASFGRARLLDDERAVLDLVTGRSSARDIVAASHMGSFDVTKMLYRLLRSKLIRRRVAPVVS